MYNYTIIIPHYNIPQLLERCVASIPMRDDIQTIVVDDCSPDSPELTATVQRLKLRKNLEFYRTKLGGSAGRARNLGLDYALGKWLIFADADDFFDQSFSEKLDRYLNAEGDVIYFNFRSVRSENISQISNRESDYNKFFEQYDKNHNEDNFRFLYCTPWGKIIKRSLVENNKIRFDETRYANDAMFAVLVGCKAQSILPVDEVLYVLTERTGSLANNFCRKAGETVIRAKVALRIQKVIKDNGHIFPYDYQIYIRILLWNGEFQDLLNLYHTIADYDLTKSNILNIVRHTGRRYWLVALWLIWQDWMLLLFRRR